MIFQRYLLLLCLFVGAMNHVQAEPEPALKPVETVVLLHGIGMRSWTMWRVESQLKRASYRVLNLNYPSRKLPLVRLGREWLPEQLRRHGIGDGERVHFVTHSMGGIVLRMWMREVGPPPNLGRVVMIGPPNGGSAAADRLRHVAISRWYMGPNLTGLGTDEASIPRSLGPWPAPTSQLGIIAGDRAINPLFSAWLAEPNDGAVAVRSAPLEGMSDFLVLHHSHTFLLWRADTLRAVKTFLATARFQPTPPLTTNPKVSSIR